MLVNLNKITHTDTQSLKWPCFHLNISFTYIYFIDSWLCHLDFCLQLSTSILSCFLLISSTVCQSYLSFHRIYSWLHCFLLLFYFHFTNFWFDLYYSFHLLIWGIFRWFLAYTFEIFHTSFTGRFMYALLLEFSSCLPKNLEDEFSFNVEPKNFLISSLSSLNTYHKLHKRELFHFHVSCSVHTLLVSDVLLQSNKD